MRNDSTRACDPCTTKLQTDLDFLPKSNLNVILSLSPGKDFARLANVSNYSDVEHMHKPSGARILVTFVLVVSYCFGTRKVRQHRRGVFGQISGDNNYTIFLIAIMQWHFHHIIEQKCSGECSLGPGQVNFAQKNLLND